MTDLLDALGLFLVIEGLFYCGFPAIARKLAEEIRVTPDTALRIGGLVAMVLGVLIVWFARG